MYLIQILLPLYANDGQQFAQTDYTRVRDELTDAFGGLTTYLRSPAEGLWKESGSATVYDDIVIYEVMTKYLDKTWWHKYRAELATRFQQEVLIVRVSKVQLL